MRSRRQRYINKKHHSSGHKKVFPYILAAVIAAVGSFLILAGCYFYGSSMKAAASRPLPSKEEAVSIPVSAEPEISLEADATIVSAGDIIMHTPFLRSSLYHKEDGSYDYHPVFAYIKEIFENADYAVVNLECTLSDGDYSDYPVFRSPDAIADTLKDIGVDLCLLANNHIYDNFDEGLSLTTGYLDQKSLSYTGVKKTPSDQTYTIQNIGGITVGIFNYVYETPSYGGQKTINAIPVSSESAALINSFNYNDLDTFYDSIRRGLQEMQAEGVEYTIAYMHWGEEYALTENENQRQIAQELCDLGIDAIIGGHPHVVQPADVLTSSFGDHQTVCVYSVGNLVSNQRTEYMEGLTQGHTEDGLVVSLTIHRDEKGAVSLTDVTFIPIWVYHSMTYGGEHYILPLSSSETLAESTGLDNITEDVAASLARTNTIIGTGMEKIRNALPIAR